MPSDEAFKEEKEELKDEKDDKGEGQVSDDMQGPRAVECSVGSCQAKFVAHFSVGAPLSGTVHRGQLHGAQEGHPGAEVEPQAPMQHGFDDSQFDGFAAESEDPFATPP